MASLHIDDDETSALVARLAERAGVTHTALVRDLALQREAEVVSQDRRSSILQRLDQFSRDNPLPPPTGKKADKAFYDELWGED